MKIFSATGRHAEIVHDPGGIPAEVDNSTHSLQIVDYAHHEIHGGSKYYVIYSVASLGAMTTPDDMITLTFTTPDTTKWGHFEFAAKGTSGWRIRFIEAPTGGATAPTGALTILNQNRNSANTSGFLDLTPTAGQVSYDATLATGGTALWDEYIPGSSSPSRATSGTEGTRDEKVLKQNTQYQLSLFGTDTHPGTLLMTWYEHTDKD